MTVLHIGGNDKRSLMISLTTPNGTKKDIIPEEYLVSYKKGKFEVVAMLKLS